MAGAPPLRGCACFLIGWVVVGISLLAASVLLHAFGWIYDLALVSRMNRPDAYPHPLTAGQVVIGVMITVLGAWLVDGDAMRIRTLFICFVASGVPMIVGDVRRWYATQF